MLQECISDLPMYNGYAKLELINPSNGQVEKTAEISNAVMSFYSNWWKNIQKQNWMVYLEDGQNGFYDTTTPNHFPIKEVVLTSDSTTPSVDDAYISGNIIGWASRIATSGPTGKQGTVVTSLCKRSYNQARWVFEWPAENAVGTFQSICWGDVNTSNQTLYTNAAEVEDFLPITIFSRNIPSIYKDGKTVYYIDFVGTNTLYTITVKSFNLETRVDSTLFTIADSFKTAFSSTYSSTYIWRVGSYILISHGSLNPYYVYDLTGTLLHTGTTQSGGIRSFFELNNRLYFIQYDSNSTAGDGTVTWRYDLMRCGDTPSTILTPTQLVNQAFTFTNQSLADGTTSSTSLIYDYYVDYTSEELVILPGRPTSGNNITAKKYSLVDWSLTNTTQITSRDYDYTSWRYNLNPGSIYAYTGSSGSITQSLADNLYRPEPDFSAGMIKSRYAGTDFMFIKRSPSTRTIAGLTKYSAHIMTVKYFQPNIVGTRALLPAPFVKESGKILRLTYDINFA